MKKVLTILLVAIVSMLPQMALASEGAEHQEGFDFKGIIFHHLGDGYGWEVPFSHTERIPLPVIVRSESGSWHVFSSGRVTKGDTYEGFKISHGEEYNGKVVEVRADGSLYRPLDLSITKDVAELFIVALLVLLAAFSVKRWYKRNGMKAPHRVTAMMEFITEYIYEGVIRPTLGKDAKKFAPYLLTVFFFVLFANLIGLMVIFPGGANLTGNIAVTMVLAVFTFVITNLFGNKHYWKEIFWPDVPLWLKFPIPIMPLIEVFGMFTKPAALMVRLFANMMGGHMIVISLTMIIFIFANKDLGVAVTGASTVVSVAFSLFMLVLDTLVSFIQAFVFTMLSTLFISLARPHEEEGEH